jgi:hypothetical protein
MSTLEQIIVFINNLVLIIRLPGRAQYLNG